MFNWFDGKKTKITAVIVAVLGVLVAFGVDVPDWVYTVLTGLGLYAGRDAVAKIEKQ